MLQCCWIAPHWAGNTWIGAPRWQELSLTQPNHQMLTEHVPCARHWSKGWGQCEQGRHHPEKPQCLHHRHVFWSSAHLMVLTHDWTFIHSLTHSLTDWLTHLFTHSPIIRTIWAPGTWAWHTDTTVSITHRTVCMGRWQINRNHKSIKLNEGIWWSPGYQEGLPWSEREAGITVTTAFLTVGTDVPWGGRKPVCCGTRRRPVSWEPGRRGV